MTVIQSELEILEALDFDPTESCESVKGCDKEADWNVRLTCCNAVFALCDGCFKSIFNWFQNMKAIGSTVDCYNCGAEGMEPGTHLIEWTKI